MISKSAQILTLATVTGLLASGYATAQMGSASASVSMRAVVPLVCRVGFTPSTEPNVLGEASQLCNDADGYTLYALATGDVNNASLSINGTRVPLVAGREVVIEEADHPVSKKNTIGYDPGENSSGGNLTLRIEAK
jgi:hypothetical protein